MGTQSTGKSTLLNTMFGCRLKVSAGQCTRGMNVELVTAENREEKFDYVLVIDTEGLRSPEFFGTDGAIWRDNRMATLSVLPSDACIVTTVNEEDSAIKEVLPIVMLAFKGSTIAEEITGRLRAMLFFVYSRVDTSRQALEKFENNRRKLQLELEDAVSKIEGHKIAGDGSVIEENVKKSPEKGQTASKTSGTLNKFVRNFKLHEDEEKSDVKYLGLLNKGDKPPDDTPNFDFGEKVIKLREYIVQRLSQNNFQSQTLTKWWKYLEKVSQCIEATDFELNFKTAMEYGAFRKLKSNIDHARQLVSQQFSKQYQLCANKITRLQEEPPKLEDLERELHRGAKDTIIKQEEFVKKQFEQDCFKQFEMETLINLENFINNTKQKYSKLLTDCYEAQFHFKKKVDEYEKAILEKLRHSYGEKPKALKDTGRREKEFEDVFKKQYDQAEKDHPQMNVQEEIEKEYAEHRHIKFGVSTQNVGKQWDIPLIWRFVRCVDHSKSDFEIKCDKLIAKARVKVESVKHYDSSVVQEIIDLTEKTISDENITSKDKQNTIHYKIKELLQSEFKRIQDQWNDSNNIASKLLAAKLRLRNKFESVCEDFIETHAVVQDIVDSVKEALHLGFIEYLAEATKGIVEKKSWIGSSEVIQAHIDMHLLSLSKEERIQELIQEIMNSSDHYNKILSKLIMECVDSQGTWIRLVKQIC